MGKYNNKLVMDYINGNDIDGYDIDDLENDFEFMIQVIRLSDDKKMYNFCSEKVKKDYRLVKFLINKYNNDLKYICNVADEFLKSIDDGLERIEILLLMDKYISIEEPNNQYKIALLAIYTKTRVEIESYKAKYKDEDIGMGFLVMYDSFNSNELITDFFASKTIDSIFYEYDINLEEYLHSKYKDFETIEKQGINNFLINFISTYDKMLSSYLSAKIQLLRPLVTKMNFIKINWENYNRRMEFNIYNTLLDEVYKYMEEHEFKYSYLKMEILYYAAMQLGISEKVKEYERLDDDIYNDVINFFNDYMDESTLSLNDIFHIKKIQEIMLNCLNENFFEQNYETKNNDQKGKCKILKFDDNKNRHLSLIKN